MIGSSLVNRIKLIVSGGASRLIVSLQSVIISFVIIRWYSATLWGEAVIYILFLDLGFSVIAWGTTPYLLREFSFHPNYLKQAWRNSFWSRTILLLGFSFIIFFSSFNSSEQLILFGWAFARYVYHSFESIIQFERKFVFSLLVEALGLGLVLLPVLVFPQYITLQNLLILFASSMAVKALATTFYFRSFISIPVFSWNFFLASFPFLMLTFSAMIQQRADLYCVAFYLGKEETATYQIFINLIIFAQFLASLLLSPFAKNIYRLPQKSLSKLQRNFTLAGIPLSALSLGGIFIAIQYLYNLKVDLKLYLLGYFYILAFYTYLLKNYELGKNKQQLRVSIFSLAASIVTIILSIWLTPRLHLYGALLAGLMGQLVLVILYHSKFARLYAFR